MFEVVQGGTRFLKRARGKRLTIFFGDGDGTARVEVHRNVDLRGARAQSPVARAPRAVLEGGGTVAGLRDEKLQVQLVAIYDGDEELRLRIDRGKADALIRHQSLITDAATRRAKFFERDVKVMKDVRIIDESRRVCVAEAHRDACGKFHKTVTSDE